MSLLHYGLGWVIVFNATFSNISFIMWQSVLLMEVTGVPGENHRSVSSRHDTDIDKFYAYHTFPIQHPYVLPY